MARRCWIGWTLACYFISQTPEVEANAFADPQAFQKSLQSLGQQADPAVANAAAILQQALAGQPDAVMQQPQPPAQTVLTAPPAAAQRPTLVTATPVVPPTPVAPGEGPVPIAPVPAYQIVDDASEELNQGLLLQDPAAGSLKTPPLGAGGLISSQAVQQQAPQPLQLQSGLPPPQPLPQHMHTAQQVGSAHQAWGPPMMSPVYAGETPQQLVHMVQTGDHSQAEEALQKLGRQYANQIQAQSTVGGQNPYQANPVGYGGSGFLQGVRDFFSNAAVKTASFFSLTGTPGQPTPVWKQALMALASLILAGLVVFRWWTCESTPPQRSDLGMSFSNSEMGGGLHTASVQLMEGGGGDYQAPDFA